MEETVSQANAHIEVVDLTMAYGSFVIQRDLTFTVQRGDIFIIMGGSGCGKSTLLRHLIGLKAPARGAVFSSRGEIPILGRRTHETAREPRVWGIHAFGAMTHVKARTKDQEGQPRRPAGQ